ncbi:MAG: hypothetical protein JWP25_4692 [Bradyrhizobium sp.]|nr:hypothetical protein [Bradyrhizobium sp.]
MANANSPRGLIPYAYIWGGKYDGSVNTYFVPASYATALYPGDPVDIISSSNDANGIPAVKLATVGSPILGVVVGIINGGDMGSMTAVTRDQPIYHPASTAQYLAIADDPNLLFMTQDDASAQATAPTLWAGKNANLVSGTGSTVGGYSGWQMAASTVATTNTLDVKIIRPLQQADNTIGSAANTNMNAKWLVKLNNSRFANLIAGI